MSGIERFTLRNVHGVEVDLLNYGATIASIRVPDRFGTFDDIVLGLDRADEYRGEHPYFGAVVGRYANRIARGRFELDGHTYMLATNDGPNHMHGGERGFNAFTWEATLEVAGAMTFSRVSPDGEEGYPGALQVAVSYALTEDSELIVRYTATTDRTTVLNLTQHTYFNLGGHASGDVLGHELTLDAARFTPVDETQIPTGTVLPVEGTPFDFRFPLGIGARIADRHPQLEAGKGYDHNWVLDAAGDASAVAARVAHPPSGRTLEVRTTEPGVQFYSGNLLDGSLTGKDGVRYQKHAGLCLETQHFPDSPNHPSFPSTVLRPGEEFRSTTVFRFDVEE
jgi:aldose 1-epimerase